MSRTVLLRPKPHDRRDVWNADLLRGCRFDGEWEMPVLQSCDCIPEKLTVFTNAQTKLADGSFIHFYEDDYLFERIWRIPKRYLSLIKAYGGAIAPDFSIYREMPLAQQMHNIFRSRTLGYWWSQNGVKVIPNVRWGDERTYKFCFDGLPKNSVVAIGTHGCVKHTDDRRYFFNGFIEMLDRITPKKIIVYGSASDRIFSPLFSCNTEIIHFESDFSRVHKRKDI
ncbi:MAG: DUF4417 domain-containing protein [Spirochaetota bacterium]|jgi:hypothetical protein|nr:DUF4417 domain-containing protein [Spirochaetota bacterium]